MWAGGASRQAGPSRPIVESRRKGMKRSGIGGHYLSCHWEAGCYVTALPPSVLCFFNLQYSCDALHNELYTGDGHTVAQGFVTGRIRCGWDVCPPIWETLQTLALKRCQAANQVDSTDNALIIVYILIADSLMV